MQLPSMFDPLNAAFWQVVFSLWQTWALFGAVLAVRLALSFLERRRLARSGIWDIDEMTGPMFEQYLVVLFRQLGYRVEHVGQQGDYGADLILARDGARTVVQAKRWRKNVGVNAVREAVAAKNMYHCTKAMVVTNSDFTQQARTLARANDVELWDRQRLVSTMLSVRSKAAAATGGGIRAT